MSWHYPLIQNVRELYRTADMSDVLLLACQHLLGSQYQLFTSLAKLGLKPENCVIAGKSYSTNSRVCTQLTRHGFSVAPWSNSFASDEPFDGWFERNLDEFIGNELRGRKLDRYRQIVILDDGGFLHSVCNRHFGEQENIAGVEQTTSGDTRIRSLNLPYPVVSLARSYIKQQYEAPYIGKLACERILAHVQKRHKEDTRILVLGLGTIGRQVLGRLHLLGKCDAQGCDVNLASVADFMTVQILRNQRRILENHDDVTDKIADCDVVIGATGSPLFDETFITKLHPDVSLISVSSSDREFPAVCFRKGGQSSIHNDYYLGNRCLVNAGFPITFYGNYHEVPPREIELTVACLMAGVLHSAQLPEHSFPFPLIAARLVHQWQSECQSASVP